MKAFLLILSGALFGFNAAAASPIGNVGTARVDAGAVSIEQRMGFTSDSDRPSIDDRFQMRQHIDYGVNDWYAVRLLTAQDDRGGDNLEFASISFENRIQLFEKRDHGFDGGMRFIYGHRDGDKTPHEIDMRLMAMGDFGEDDRWSWRHNTVFEHDIGENSRSGVMLELRHQLAYKLDSPDESIQKWQVGLEMFNDFGRLNDAGGFSQQDHQLGPVMKLNFNNGMYLQTGYRAGISQNAPDHLFKLFIGRAF